MRKNINLGDGNMDKQTMSLIGAMCVCVGTLIGMGLTNKIWSKHHKNICSINEEMVDIQKDLLENSWRREEELMETLRKKEA